MSRICCKFYIKFLLTSNEVEDKVVEAINNPSLKIIATNLSKEGEEKLRAAYDED